MRYIGTIAVCVFTAAAAQPLAAAIPTPPPSARAAPKPDALFSRRALRHARLLIQMRLLELRDERLECIRQAILRRLPPELRPEAANQRTDKRLESEDCTWKATAEPLKPPA